MIEKYCFDDRHGTACDANFCGPCLEECDPRTIYTIEEATSKNLLDEWLDAQANYKAGQELDLAARWPKR